MHGIYGRWVQVGAEFRDGRYTRVPCRCVCGSIGSPRKAYLLSGRSRSCGCLMREVNARRHHTHGASGTRSLGGEHRGAWPEYGIWNAMRQRCANANDRHWKEYGGRGITVCERWASFANFIEDLGRRPDPTLTLERRDNECNYEPGNCFWATRTEQANNKRNNKMLTYAGRSLSISAWGRETGLPASALYKRVEMGWSTERILTTPSRGMR